MRAQHLISVVLTLALPVALILMGATASKQHQERTCTGVDIRINYGDAQPLMTRQMIIDIIGNVYDSLPGRPLGKLDVEWFRMELEGIPYVKHASVRTDPSGSVSIQVRQRKPLARVINGGSHSYFLADDGMIMPSYPEMGAVLPVITAHFSVQRLGSPLAGTHIDSLHEHHLLRDIFGFAVALNERPFMVDLVEQVDISHSGNMILVPVLGPERILFGGSWKMEIKLRNIEAFYRKTCGRVDWSVYKALDARFENQIVGIKAE